MKEKAIALKYNELQDDAPKVVAKGEGDIAKQIIERAEEYGVPVQKDESLIALLSEVDINERIPEELYGVVAELFAFIYQLDKEVGRKNYVKKT
ncbi:EscU/YscU/HrcU family type III secretion system export apparatus switch protein [Bacillus kexueae]|uniref:EscU/YscU/HrcU family type III secretion system export apparatus switch protein n=1 Tax=Aeribacillus kexueae TaxID=2078952 RepID=UPI001FAFF06C|nr:EscU/YscU/HrcU family type III secretion system export apparatus switch protein [Bacillus kexueae]